jgi:hypothetical protein
LLQFNLIELLACIAEYLLVFEYTCCHAILVHHKFGALTWNYEFSGDVEEIEVAVTPQKILFELR